MIANILIFITCISIIYMLFSFTKACKEDKKTSTDYIE